MYLSRLRLNARNRATRRDLGDLQAIHRTIMSAFPTAGPTAPAEQRVLWRLEPDAHRGSAVLLVQSATAPDWSRLAPGYLEDDRPEVKPIDAALASVASGMRLRFRLVANPTKRVLGEEHPDGRHAKGERIPLRGDEALLAWLARKGVDAGFSVGPDSAGAARAVVIRPLGDLVGWRPRDSGDRASQLTLRGVAFDGILMVTDASRLRGAVASGIGSGKAYGFGLLSLAPGGGPR